MQSCQNSFPSQFLSLRGSTLIFLPPVQFNLSASWFCAFPSHAIMWGAGLALGFNRSLGGGRARGVLESKQWLAKTTFELFYSQVALQSFDFFFVKKCTSTNVHEVFTLSVIKDFFRPVLLLIEKEHYLNATMIFFIFHTLSENIFTRYLHCCFQMCPITLQDTADTF